MRIGPLGIWELLIILVVVLLIFGPRRLPEMAKGLGQSVREFRKGIRDIKNDFEEGEKGGSSAKAEPQQATAAPTSSGSQTAPPTPPAPAPTQAAEAEAPVTPSGDVAQEGDEAKPQSGT